MTDAFDEQLLTRLEAIDHPRQPSEVTDEMVSARMLARFRDEQTASSVVEFGEVTELGSERGTAPTRWRWMLSAAAVVVLIIGVGTVARQERSGEPSGASDEILPPPSEPKTSNDSDQSDASDAPDDPTPTEAPIASDLLGYDPLSTVAYRSEDPATGEMTFLYDRLGETTPQGSGSAGTVRRTVGADLVDHSITIFAADSIVVPVDFLDPPALGGRCSGGDVPLEIDRNASTSVSSTCDGADITLPVSLIWAEPEPSDLDGLDGTARAVTITIGEGSEQRIATWWFSDAGAIAFELPDGMTFIRDFESSDASITQEEGP